MSRALKRKTTIEYGTSKSSKKARTASNRRSTMVGPRSNSKFLPTPTVEQKYYTFTWGGTTAYIGNTDTLTCVNTISAGTNVASMIGRKATLKSLQLNFQIITPPLVAASFGFYKNLPVRVIFFYDKNTDGARPTVLDYLTTHDTRSLRNLDNADRFISLYDKTFETGQNSMITGSTTYNMCGGVLSQTEKAFVKMNLPYDGPYTASPVTGINSGAIFYIAIQDNVPASSGTYITGTSRVRFTDA